MLAQADNRLADFVKNRHGNIPFAKTTGNIFLRYQTIERRLVPSFQLGGLVGAAFAENGEDDIAGPAGDSADDGLRHIKSAAEHAGPSCFQISDRVFCESALPGEKLDAPAYTTVVCQGAVILQETAGDRRCPHLASRAWPRWTDQAKAHGRLRCDLHSGYSSSPVFRAKYSGILVMAPSLR